MGGPLPGTSSGALAAAAASCQPATSDSQRPNSQRPVHSGVWEWGAWVAQFGGEKVPARVPGDGKLAPIEDAPGSYVKLRLDTQR